MDRLLPVRPSEKPPISLIPGPIEVEMQLDLTLLTLREQNEFLAAMDAAGFGNPAEGRYTTVTPPKLVEPLRRATFTFGEEDPANAEASIDEAKGIAAKHRVRFVGARTLPTEKTVSRITVAVGTELLLTAASMDEALDILKETGFDGDACLWNASGQLMAVHFAGHSVLRLWPQGLPQDVTRN